MKGKASWKKLIYQIFVHFSLKFDSELRWKKLLLIFSFIYNPLRKHNTGFFLLRNLFLKLIGSNFTKYQTVLVKSNDLTVGILLYQYTMNNNII